MSSRPLRYSNFDEYAETSLHKDGVKMRDFFRGVEHTIRQFGNLGYDGLDSFRDFEGYEQLDKLKKW